MRTGTPMPMRTQAELRAALTALEDQAPSADAVLNAVRAAGTRRPPGRARALRRARSPRWPQLVTAIATAAAAACLSIALLPAGARPGEPSTGPEPGTPVPAAPRLPSAEALGAAMLTAFAAATGDVLYWTETGFNGRTVTDVYRSWAWPAQPVLGHTQRWRSAFAQRYPGRGLLPVEDDGFVYITPRASANYVYGRLTVVCYAGTGWGGCGYGNTNTAPGTWSLSHRRFVNPSPGLDDLSPPALAREVAAGQWRVIRRTHLAGQQVIELSETQRGTYRPLPTLLWVNAHTHLPLRMTIGAGTAQADQNAWYYLKPTAANLAMLRVPIPAGYGHWPEWLPGVR